MPYQRPYFVRLVRFSFTPICDAAMRKIFLTSRALTMRDSLTNGLLRAIARTTPFIVFGALLCTCLFTGFNADFLTAFDTLLDPAFNANLEAAFSNGFRSGFGPVFDFGFGAGFVIG